MHKRSEAEISQRPKAYFFFAFFAFFVFFAAFLAFLAAMIIS
jgi:hypothetical protein